MIYSTFLGVEAREYFSGFSTSLGHVIYLHLPKAVFHLTLTVGVPRWEVEGSKWNRAVRGNCGNLGGRWQVGNDQWKVGTNLDWFHPLTVLFSINFSYIHILFNLSEGRKAARFFLV